MVAARATPRDPTEVVLVSRERVNFVRPLTHTHVRETDPECRDLLRYGEWFRERILLLWLARQTEEGDVRATDYLGSVRAWEDDLDRSSMRRVLRRLVDVMPGTDRREICRGLRQVLEQFKAE